MDTTPYQRLEAFWLSKGLKNMSAFAEQVGLKPATISAIKQRGSRPSNPVMHAIQQMYPDLNPEYILWNTGPMLRDGRELTRLPADPAPAKVEAASPLQVVAESEQVRELKEQIRELREHNKLLTDLLRSGVDLSKLQKAVGSFKLDGAPAVVEPRPTMMVAA